MKQTLGKDAIAEQIGRVGGMNLRKVQRGWGNIRKRLGGEGAVFPGDRDLKRLLKRDYICHSENNQYVGIWTPVTGMKMRFCERCIRVNRQGLGSGRKDETTKWRHLAVESEVAITVSNPVCAGVEAQGAHRKVG